MGPKCVAMPGGVVLSGTPGQIAQIVIVGSQAGRTAQESALIAAANQAWFALPADMDLPIWPDGAAVVEAGVFPKSANVRPGQVLYAQYKDGGNWEIRARLEWPSMVAMKDTYLAVLLNQNLPATGEEFQPEEDKKLSLGLGLFNLWIPDFLPNLPPLVWLLIALLSGYGAYEKKKIVPRVALGAVAWIAAAKFIQSNQKNIRL
jgi:hypothetical protein